MQYLLLIYESEELLHARDPEVFQKDIQEYFALNRELGDRMLAGEALQSVETAKSVRVRQGESVHTDGPFAETKEQLGGFYLIEASDLDEAKAWAAKIPAARYGCVEVRPIMSLPDRP